MCARDQRDSEKMLAADDFENLLHAWFSIVQAVSFGGLLRSQTTQSMRSDLAWCVDSAVGNLVEPSQRQSHEAGLGVVWAGVSSTGRSSFLSSR